MRTPRNRPPAPTAGPWSRERLLVLLTALSLAALVLITGLGMALWHATSSQRATPDPATSPQPPSDSLTQRDRIASAPMASLDSQAAFTPDPATAPAPAIVVPPATTGRGPAGVATGFPPTPEGAVGQLAAIEQAVLESMSLPVTRDVHTAWVQPGGPTFEGWELTRNVHAFLAASRQGGQVKDLTTQVTATPAMGLVKGSDGPGWTLACVLMDVTASIKADTRMGYGLCARMEWIQGRWQIAAGADPAAAPSAWPGSNAASSAGWRTWTQEP